MRLTVTTPLCVVMDEEGVASVRAEDETGGFGILPGHADLLTVLRPSVLRWRRAEGPWQFVALHGGVLQLSRDHLREVVWGQNAEVQSRSLDTHVSRLRNLLNLRAGQPYAISAVYGYGYRLDAPEAAQPAAPAA